MTETVWRGTITSITDHICETIKSTSDDEVEKLISEIMGAKRIFVYGAGRSGLAARAFSMRLMHLDFIVYVIGETITPSMNKDDIFIAISGSGETISVIDYVESVKKLGARVIAVTSHKESTLGKLADLIVLVKGKTKIDMKKDHEERQLQGIYSSLTPMGTLFEDTVMIFFDGMIAELMQRLNKNEQQMMAKHTSVE